MPWPQRPAATKKLRISPIEESASSSRLSPQALKPSSSSSSSAISIETPGSSISASQRSAFDLGELVPGRQQLRERRACRLVPYARPRGLVAPLGEPDDQRLPPAMAGRITIVSLSETPVSRPWSTRTSSSLRYTFT